MGLFMSTDMVMMLKKLKQGRSIADFFAILLQI